MVNNYNQDFAFVPAPIDDEINLCRFFYKKKIYDERCPKCKMIMFINSRKQKDLVENIKNTNVSNCIYEFNEKENKYYKNYMSAYCLNCKTNYEINFKIKYYCFFGLFCFQIVNLYT